MNDTPTWRTFKNLTPILLFLSVCVLFLFSNPCFWLFGDPLFVERCGLDIENQTGKALRITPFNSNRDSYAAVRLYRTAFPIFPAYRQRNIVMKPGDRLSLSFDCSPGVSELYICDLDGECYIRQSVFPSARAEGIIVPYEKYTLESLESLPRPYAALQAAVRSFPKHNYRGPTNVLFGLIQIFALIGGVYGLIRTRPSEIRRIDI